MPSPTLILSPTLTLPRPPTPHHDVPPERLLHKRNVARDDVVGFETRAGKDHRQAALAQIVRARDLAEERQAFTAGLGAASQGTPLLFGASPCRDRQ